MSLATLNPIPLYWGLDGLPLDDGFIYYGSANLNPIAFPVTVYWDAAATQPAAQPIRTLNGYPMRNGSPAVVYATAAYSVLVQDKRGVQVLYAPNSVDFSNAAILQAQITQVYTDLAAPATGTTLLGWLRNLTGAVGTTLYRLLNLTDPTPLEWMSAAQQDDVRNGSGLVDVTAAVQAWANSGGSRGWLPAGKYRLTDEITVPVGFSFRGAGIGKVIFQQITANKGVFKYADANAAYRYIGGFTAQGAGIGAATSVGVALGNAALTHVDNYCEAFDIEATGFGVGIKSHNPIECEYHRLHCHGNDIGFAHVGSAIPGSNAFNLIDYVECFDNRVDYFSDLGDENSVRRLYTWTNAGVTVLHNIWLRDSSLNDYTEWHCEPLPGCVQTGAEVLFESTAGNIRGDMIGNKLNSCKWWFNGGTVDKLQIGTAAGKKVYSTEVKWCDWLPATGGTFNINLLNEDTTQIEHPRLRSGTYNNVVRSITVNNPNSATNRSYVGTPFDLSYAIGTNVTPGVGFVPVLFASTSAASLGALTPYKTIWSLEGKMLKVQMDFTIPNKNASTGTITVRGVETITPNAGGNIFAGAVAGMAVACTMNVYSAAGVRRPWNAFLQTTTGFISLLIDATGAAVQHTDVTNGDQFCIEFFMLIG